MSIKETWKDVPGFEGSYQVSNLGRVKSIKRWAQYLTTYPSGTTVVKKRSVGGIILSPSIDSQGYYHVRLAEGNGKYTLFKLHKLVYEVFVQKIPEGMTVNHIDENKLNNMITNLQIVSRKQNLKLFRNGHPENSHYIDNYGQQFCSFKRYCKRHKLIFNKYRFMQSIRNNSKYFNTNYKFRKTN